MNKLNKSQVLVTMSIFLFVVMFSGIISFNNVSVVSTGAKLVESNESDSSDAFDPRRLSTFSGLLSEEPDYSSARSLAISLSYPIFSDGIFSHPASFTGGGKTDRILVSRQYYNAKLRANQIALKNRSRIPPNHNRNFADCGAFVSTVIVNTIDPNYPGLFVYKQRQYVENPKSGWLKVGSSTDDNRPKLQPGDVFITNADMRSGHTWIWLGTIGTLDEMIADASFGSDESSTAHLPALRKNPLESSELDSRGRSYDIWRFVGR